VCVLMDMLWWRKSLHASMPEAFRCLLVERHAKMKQSFPDEACCSFNE
jgi:hypothetical protein